MNKDLEFISNWLPVKEAFDECMAPVIAEIVRTVGPPTPENIALVRTFILRLFGRMRGKDFIKTYMGKYKNKTSEINTTRGSLAAVATAASNSKKDSSKSNSKFEVQSALINFNMASADAVVEEEQEEEGDIEDTDEKELIELEHSFGECEMYENGLELEEAQVLTCN